MDKERFVYYLIRTFTLPFQFMPYSWIRFIGKRLGTIGFYLLREYRKRVLSNLALAQDLKLSRKELIRTAKASFQNLAINCLEYPKFANAKSLAKSIRCENPEVAQRIYDQKKGIIFFCGHQSNWEVLFLDGTSRMKGVAIGKSIKNKRLYRWILSIREQNGGKIVLPKNAVKEGLRALKKGEFIGIVGDQGMPDSGYAFPFLGRRAWTSTAPALLAYKTGCPIIFAETKRIKKGYKVLYADPIWPDKKVSLEKDVVRMMDQLLTLLEKSIKESPGEWLWQHNRWKQQTIHSLYKKFRHDCICIILPKKEIDAILPHLKTIKEIYPLVFLTLIVPKEYQNIPLIKADETIYYEKKEETFLNDLRFKMIFNFTDDPKINAHYEKLSALEIIDIDRIYKLASEHAKPHHDLSDLLKRALCKPGSIWEKEEHAC